MFAHTKRTRCWPAPAISRRVWYECIRLGTRSRHVAPAKSRQVVPNSIGGRRQMQRSPTPTGHLIHVRSPSCQSDFQPGLQDAAPSSAFIPSPAGADVPSPVKAIAAGLSIGEWLSIQLYTRPTGPTSQRGCRGHSSSPIPRSRIETALRERVPRNGSVLEEEGGSFLEAARPARLRR